MGAARKLAPSPETVLDAAKHRRRHALQEQLFAEAKWLVGFTPSRQCRWCSGEHGQHLVGCGLTRMAEIVRELEATYAG